MISLSRTQYRGLVLATIALYLVTLAIVELHLVHYSHDMEVAHSWNGYAALLTYSVRLYWSLTLPVLLLASLAGLLFFRNFARWTITALLVIQLTAEPFKGLLVLMPIEHFLASLTGWMICLVVTVSIFSPVAAEFDAKHVKSSLTAP